MPTVLPEKLCQQFRSRIDHLGLLVEAGCRSDEARHLQHPAQTRQVAKRFLEAGQPLHNADARLLARRVERDLAPDLAKTLTSPSIFGNCPLT